MFTIQKIAQVIFSLLIFFAVAGLLYYLITIVPIPAPYKDWTLIALQVMVVIALIGMLLDWAGVPVIRRNPPPSA
jgi:hypothetical protein